MRYHLTSVFEPASHVRRFGSVATAALLCAAASGCLGPTGAARDVSLVGTGGAVVSQAATGAGGPAPVAAGSTPVDPDHTVRAVGGPGAAPVSEAIRSNPPDSFSISGGVAGLYPGAVLPLELTVRNRWDFTIRVRTIVVTVTGAASSCATGVLSVSSFSGGVFVHPGQSVEETVWATMAPSAPNACQGASFTLHYNGTAVHA
jgi:hypothetical protein